MSGKKGKKDKDSNTEEVFVLILGGLPGSGKSTFSTELSKLGWVRINQDDLLTAEECKKALEKALKHSRSVIIDRCNVHPKERKMWITEAKRYGSSLHLIVECVFLHISSAECIQRVKERRNHPNVDPADAEKVISEFLRYGKRLLSNIRGFKLPEAWEGPYQKVSIPTNNEEVKNVLKQYSGYAVRKK